MIFDSGDTGDVGGYAIANSLRLRPSASAYLAWTPSVTGNRQKWKFATRLKLGTLGTGRCIFSAGVNPGGTNFYLGSDNCLHLTLNVTAVETFVTTAVYRDPSAWYDIELDVDTTQAVASGRAKLTVNGVLVTSFSSTNYPAQNFNTQVNESGRLHRIGLESYGTTQPLDGYIAEPRLTDGFTGGVFSEFNSDGVWVPKVYTGSYGTNGFYLKFNDGSNLTNLCLDRSGNGNNWTATNVSLTAGATYDWMADTPTNNYATLNPLDQVGSPAVSDGNLTAYTGTTSANVRGTIPVSSGKWYWEVTAGTYTTSPTHMVGVCDASVAVASSAWGSANAWTYYASNGNKYNNGANSAYGATWTTGDVIGIALDMDAGTLEFYKNGVSQGVAYSGLSGKTLTSCFGSAFYTLYCHHNFGQRPFAYTPPTGFKALCTANMPAVAITNGRKHFDAFTRTGTAASYTRTGMQFAPDLVWIKDRAVARDHALYDTVRGATKYLASNLTNAESTQATELTAFASDGYSLGGGVNANSAEAYVDWSWKAGGAAVTNTAGSITSQVSANTTAGFSIVTFTAAGGTPQTVGHGLGVAPKLVIVKSRSATATSWVTWHAGLTSGNHYLVLNGTAAQALDATVFSASPTSTVLSLGSQFLNTQTHVAYCFAEVPGFSKFGSYTGNGSTDGPFVFCGFRPRWILRKGISTAGVNWSIIDTSRNSYNVSNSNLYPNDSGAEVSNGDLDVISNGFKLRNASFNTSGETYIFAAFAENPFGGSNVAPVTAR